MEGKRVDQDPAAEVVFGMSEGRRTSKPNKSLSKRRRTKKMKSFSEFLAEKKWIQGAVDPKHKGFCTPMTKKTCTPRRKALAKRFKGGDIQKANLKKGKNPKGKG